MPLIVVGLGIAAGLSLFFSGVDSGVQVKRANRQARRLARKRAAGDNGDMLLEQMTYLMPEATVKKIVGCGNGCGAELEEGRRLADALRDQMVVSGRGLVCEHGVLHPTA